MSVYISGDQINFNIEKANKLGYTNYDEKLWEKIKSTSWHVTADKRGRKKYIKSSKLGLLHRFVMEHWYGREILDEATKKNYVVDHLDNDGFNCQISNLCFIPKPRNTAKGLTYDIKRIEMMDTIALNIFKDFETQYFQITIGFNKETIFIDNDKPVSINSLKILYEDDFFLVLNDAERILHEFSNYNRFNIKKLNCIKYEYMEANYFYLPPEKRDKAIFEVEGKFYINLNNGNIRLRAVSPSNNLFDEVKKKK